MKLIQLPVQSFEQQILKEVEENPALETGSNPKNEDIDENFKHGSDNDNENEINVEKFRLKSTDESLQKDKRLDFEIWYDKKKAMIVKIRYKRLGTWEYRLKKVN